MARREGPPIGNAEMDALKTHVGAEARVVYVLGGRMHTIDSRLDNLVPYDAVKVDGSRTIPFVGFNSAISKIEVPPGGTTVYENTKVTTDYHPKSAHEVDIERAHAFGVHRAAALRKQIEPY